MVETTSQLYKQDSESDTSYITAFQNQQNNNANDNLSNKSPMSSHSHNSMFQKLAQRTVKHQKSDQFTMTKNMKLVRENGLLGLEEEPPRVSEIS